MDCVFCSIVAGELAADVVLDEPDFVGFLDRRPVFKGHVLLVPRAHVDTLLDLPADAARRPHRGGPAPRRAPSSTASAPRARSSR